MIVCSKCRTEMTCSKTGRRVVYDFGHVYAGDEFQCKGCGATIVVTNRTPYFDPEAKTYTKGEEIVMP